AIKATAVDDENIEHLIIGLNREDVESLLRGDVFTLSTGAVPVLTENKSDIVLVFAESDEDLAKRFPPSLRPKALVQTGPIADDGSMQLFSPVEALFKGRHSDGQPVDFFLSRNRDVNAAKVFLRNAIKNRRTPNKITLDAYAASHRAVREMKEDGELPRRVKVRSSQYLNNLIEQDHRRVKQRIRSMLGFKRFDHAVVTISGIELAEKIKKGQFKTGKLGACNA